ncbi:MAG: hypothetical protein AAFY26_20465 [Cyanobacteria bacterium J06638_22]
MKDKQFKREMKALRLALEEQVDSELTSYSWAKGVTNEKERRKSLEKNLKEVFGDEFNLTS